MTQRGDRLIHDRQAKLDRLIQQGVDPFPPRFHRTHDTQEAGRSFLEREQAGQEGQFVTVAGRMVRLRRMGKASFADIQDGQGTMQLFLQKSAMEASYGLLESLDLGDFVGASGQVFRTKAGEVSVRVGELTMLAKAMRPPPEKFHGLQDQEQRYRQRYLDMIANRGVVELMRLRSRMITAMRSFLDSRGFLEVETPILVPVPAGAMANPFVTRHHALDRELYLRVATELYLKRLIVGGIDKVYELGRVFRNEGIDLNHNPEFTLLETYEAYADYNDVMTMVEEMVCAIAESTLGTLQVSFEGQKIDLSHRGVGSRSTPL